MNRLDAFVAVAELTYKCNHACLFCSCPWAADSSIAGEEMTTAQWCDALKAIRERGVEQVTFTGGEPSLRGDLFEILDCAKSLGLAIGLITNGKEVDRAFLDRLLKYDLLLSVSVPGVSTFFSITKNDGIDNVLWIFEQCKALGIKTTANIAVTKVNYAELYENIALPILSGASYVLLNRFLPGGRGLDNKQFLLSVDELNGMLDVAEEVLQRAGVFGHIGTELPFCAIKNPQNYKHLSVASKCAAAKNFFVIDPSGYIKVCNHSPVRTVHYTNLDGLYENEYWNRFVKSDYIPKMCAGCEHLFARCDGGCREAAHVFFGSIDDNDPIFAKDVDSTKG